MKQKLTAVITAILLLAAMAPGAVFAEVPSVDLTTEAYLRSEVTTWEDGDTLVWRYNEAKQNIRRTLTQDGETAVDVTLTYDDRGNLLSEVSKTPFEESNYKTYYEYDANGYRIRMEETFGFDSMVYEYTNDANGNPVREVFTGPDGTVLVTQYKYDSDGNEIEAVETLDGEVVWRSTTTYETTDTMQTTTTTVSGEPFDTYTIVEYVRLNSAGQLVESELLDGEGVLHTDYIYDAAGNLSKTAKYTTDDPSDRLITTYEYYEDGRIKRESSNDGSQTVYHYALYGTTFEDVDADDYYAVPVRWAVTNNPAITNGINETTFAPNEACTRAQAVTFLWRAAGEPAPKTTVSPFTDVQDKNAFYYNAVLWAVENGITSGTSATTFSPELACSRAHIVTFLHRFVRQPQADGTLPFTDVVNSDATAWMIAPIQWAVATGVTTGTSSTTFAPNANCTRGQIVTFLCRALYGKG